MLGGLELFSPTLLIRGQPQPYKPHVSRRFQLPSKVRWERQRLERLLKHMMMSVQIPARGMRRFAKRCVESIKEIGETSHQRGRDFVTVAAE